MLRCNFGFAVTWDFRFFLLRWADSLPLVIGKQIEKREASKEQLRFLAPHLLILTVAVATWSVAWRHPTFH